MSKYILIILLLLLSCPTLIFAEIIAPPQITVTTPTTSSGVVNLSSVAKISVIYILNRSQGIFDIDLYKDNCVKSSKKICSWSIAKGRYVSLNKKQNCQGDSCRYSFTWSLGKKLAIESGNYYLRVCYLVKNQGLTQAVTCSRSPNFVINAEPASKGASLGNWQLANVWGIIANLLNR